MKKSNIIIIVSLIIIALGIFFIIMARQGISPIELLADSPELLIMYFPILIPIVLNIYFIIKIFLTIIKNKNKPIKWLFIVSVIYFLVPVTRIVINIITTPNLDMSGLLLIPFLIVVFGVLYVLSFLSYRAINSNRWNVVLSIVAIILLLSSISTIRLGPGWLLFRFGKILKP